jgi:hypothetical protein
MNLSYELLAALYGAPIVFWVGFMLYMRTFTREISQFQAAVLFLLAFFLLATVVVLNIAVRADLMLLSLALVETLVLAGTLGFKLKKITAQL